MIAPTEHHDTAQDFDPETGEEKWDGFKDGRIQNFLGLDWAGKKLADYERGIEENEAARDAEIQRLNLRTALLNEPLRKQAAFFRVAIETYAREHRSDLLIGRSKTRETPSGLVLAFRKVPKSYRATDTGALLTWAKAAGCEREIFPEPVVEPLPEVAWFRRSAFNAWAAKQETLPAVVEVVPESESLTVTTKGDGK